MHSHRFPGANTALPFVNKDHEQLKITQDFLRDGADQRGHLRPGAWRRSAGRGGPRHAPATAGRLASTFAVGEESSSVRRVERGADDAGRRDRAARQGRSRRVRARRVRARRGRGAHAQGRPLLPGRHGRRLRRVGGARGDGRRAAAQIFHSGAVEDGGKGPVEPGAHFYRSLQLDEHGNPINKRNAWMHALGRLRAADPARRRGHHPLPAADSRGRGGPIALRARVNYRKFAWWNTQWAFAGVRDPSTRLLIPSRPDHDDGRWTLHRRHLQGVGPDQGDPGHPDHGDGRGQGTAAGRRRGRTAAGRRRRCWTRRCASAGTTTASGCCCRATSRRRRRRSCKVTQMEPGYADGWVNVGARAHPGRQPGRRRGGPAQGARGRPEAWPRRTSSSARCSRAGAATTRRSATCATAAAQYPRDRVVRNQLGPRAVPEAPVS